MSVLKLEDSGSVLCVRAFLFLIGLCVALRLQFMANVVSNQRTSGPVNVHLISCLYSNTYIDAFVYSQRAGAHQPLMTKFL